MELASNIIKTVIGVVIGLAIVAIAVVITVYAWPTEKTSLQAQESRPSYENYEVAVNAIKANIQRDESDSSVKAECRTSARLHDKKTEKSVVLLHGYTACPSQYSELADSFYQAGYNVYIPRAPKHGLNDGKRIVPTAQELVAYANDGASFSVALGEKSGMVGISGGGVLATWAAHYRTDAIKRLLVLAPFYEPSTEQAPKLAIKPLITLYGQTAFFPDRNDGENGTYRGLAQYLMIARNYKNSPSYVSSNLILSPGDKLVDAEIARSQIKRLSPDRPVYYTPPAWGFEHDIVSKNKLRGREQAAYADYIQVYEGKKVTQLVER